LPWFSLKRQPVKWRRSEDRGGKVRAHDDETGAKHECPREAWLLFRQRSGL